jgi:two-component system, NarL family, nitrate/nitrite response regulator NarL
VAAIRALIVDDHVLFADAIRPTLQRLGFVEIERVSQGIDALPAAIQRPPHLALVELGLPDKSGLIVGQEVLHACQEMLRACPKTKVVVLTALNDQRTVDRVVQAGLHGYLTKDSTVESFAGSIRSVLRGESVFPNESRKGRLHNWEDQDAHLLIGHLTARERQVLGLLVHGMSGEHLADHLGITSNTVRTHVQSILTKLQVHSRLEAATFAVRYGVGRTRSHRAVG